MNVIGWKLIQPNSTYLRDALDESEGTRPKWHSPSNERSSQVFCISAFGMLRRVPDGFDILNHLLSPANREAWILKFEYTQPKLLGELGGVSSSRICCIDGWRLPSHTYPTKDPPLHAPAGYPVQLGVVYCADRWDGDKRSVSRNVQGARADSV
jgi:hypothetical protein